MAGLPWHECGRGVNFTPQINRVRAVLVRDTWAWQLPPDNIAAAPGWFHIKPDNVTEEQARILVPNLLAVELIHSLCDCLNLLLQDLLPSAL